MIETNKVLVIDIDNTLSIKPIEGNYDDCEPVVDVINKMRAYKDDGFTIILYTARMMRTCGGNEGRIIAKAGPTLINWLDVHNVPYDELHFGKPWNGAAGFYVDDKAIRPTEFLNMEYEEIMDLLEKERLEVLRCLEK